MRLAIAIQNGYQELKDNNIKSALLDSELLMANVLNKSREHICLLYTSPSPRDATLSRMPSSA